MVSVKVDTIPACEFRKKFSKRFRLSTLGNKGVSMSKIGHGRYSE
jgi:hypothetical protein